MKIDEEALLRNIDKLSEAYDESDEAFEEAVKDLDEVQMADDDESLEGSK